jgi:peptide/nickel transport system permease protein
MLFAIGRKVLQGFLTLLVVASVVFFISRLSGDPIALLLPPEATAAQEVAMREAYGLDRPLIIQYLDFMTDLLRLDFGDSIRQSDTALGVVLSRLPATLELAVVSFVVGQVLAFGLAMLGEMSRSKALRSGILWLAIIRQSIPVFWFGLLLIIIFSVTLNWLPAIGNATWRHYILPTITLSTLQLALFLRLFRSAFAEAETEDYVRTARSKGIGYGQIVRQHMLPNALLPIITVAGVNFGVLLTGMVVTEIVFSWPGIGRTIVNSVLQRDFPVVQAGVIVTAGLFILVNTLTDALYIVIDPRTRRS